MKGFLTGASIAFPVGPIGILCLKRLLTRGALIGLVSGMGGATADIIFASVGIISMSIVGPVLQKYGMLVRFISSSFLIALGIFLIMSKPQRFKKSASVKGVIGAFISTLFLTLANPLLILSFMAFFSLFAVNLTDLTGMQIANLLVGIWFGSMSWWVFLAAWTRNVQLIIRPNLVQAMNRITGLIIIIVVILTLLCISIWQL